MPAVSDKWQRVAQAMRRRRLELDLTQEQAVQRSGGRISLPVWRLLEGARQESYRERTLRGVAVALEWPLDAVSQILDGTDIYSLEDRFTAQQADLYRARAELADARERAAGARPKEKSLREAEVRAWTERVELLERECTQLKDRIDSWQHEASQEASEDLPHLSALSGKIGQLGSDDQRYVEELVDRLLRGQGTR
jgi:hypothetical protein